MNKAVLLAATLITFAGTLNAQRWCFSAHCGQSPNLDFTAGHDYARLPPFSRAAVVLPASTPVPLLRPLAATRQFFTPGRPQLKLEPQTMALPAAGVNSTPAQVTLPTTPASRMTDPATPGAPGFSTGVGIPAFTAGVPK